jgi:hypothetical protein
MYDPRVRGGVTSAELLLLGRLLGLLLHALLVVLLAVVALTHDALLEKMLVFAVLGDAYKLTIHDRCA